MKRLSHAVWYLVLIPVLGFAQGAQVAPQPQHATAHKQDSYVLVLSDGVINRGNPEDRATAVAFQKSLKVKDYVWYSTPAGCAVFTDAGEMANIKEAEKPWKELSKKWPRNLSEEEKNARYAEQDRLIRQRDENIWGLYDNLKSQGKLTGIKVECPAPPAF